MVDHVKVPNMWGPSYPSPTKHNRRFFFFQFWSSPFPTFLGRGLWSESMLPLPFEQFGFITFSLPFWNWFIRGSLIFVGYATIYVILKNKKIIYVLLNFDDIRTFMITNGLKFKAQDNGSLHDLSSNLMNSCESHSFNF